jgi:hypothetical protein
MKNMFKLYDKMKLSIRRGAFFAALALPLVTAGCNQDSIFHYISAETAPTQPIISGVPSKMARVTSGETETLYMANGRIWNYVVPEDPPSGSWSRMTEPGGFVADVAATTDGVLYALTMENTTGKVWKWDGTDWTEIRVDSSAADYGFIQNIFGAGDTLFAAGARRSGKSYDYAILYKRPDDTTMKLLAATGRAPLSGAGVVGGTDYYLATRGGDGLYKAAVSGDPTAGKVPETLPSTTIAGLLQATDDTIIGVSRAGNILYIDSSGVKALNDTLGGTYTGALALMDIPPTQEGYNKLLLLGYLGASASYQHGYMEWPFKDGDLINTHGTRSIPGEKQPSSIKENEHEQYDSSLRRYPVTSLWVLPPKSVNPSSVIFAATSNQGLYSYRARSGVWEWNHEE